MKQSMRMTESYGHITENPDENQSTQKFRCDTNQFQQDITMIQKASLIVDTVTNLLCEQITNGALQIDDQLTQLPIQSRKPPMTKQQLAMEKLEQVDIEEHQRKMRRLIEANKRMRQKRSQKANQFENSLKEIESEQNKRKQQEKQKELQRRRSLIEGRMSSKSQMMAKIRQMSLQSHQRIKKVKSKKFLYEEKEEQFKVKFVLPKIEQEKKLLQRRKDRMRSIDINELLEHEKSYQVQRKTHKINRSMTSMFMKSQTLYNPPQYIPKSYLLYQAEQQNKKQKESLKIKEVQINKERVKEFVKNVSEIHKLEKEISRSRSKSPEQKQKQQSPSKDKKKKENKKQLSKEQATNVGNQYFKALLEQIKKVKEKRKRIKQKGEIQKSRVQQLKDKEDDLQIQIRSEQIRTVQKIETIERNYKIRSKKIDQVFNDSSLDPFSKYEKLKHQVQNFDMALKTRNHQSEDIKERTQATGAYLNSIKAKLKLLQISNKK